MNEEEVKKSLIEFINKKMEEMGNTDIKIKNIRVMQRPEWDALADISYIWYLNGWEKRANFTDVVFAFREGVWHSSIVF